MYKILLIFLDIFQLFKSKYIFLEIRMIIIYCYFYVFNLFYIFEIEKYIDFLNKFYLKSQVFEYRGMKFYIYIILCIKIKIKYLKVLNMKIKFIKVLYEKKCVFFYQFGCSIDFLFWNEKYSIWVVGIKLSRIF